LIRRLAITLSGQNKSNLVITILYAWLIEKGFFLKVSLIFLVKGHTKNSRDHLFNALKRFYTRVQNIEPFQYLIHIINKSDIIIATEIPSEDFHDCASICKELYVDFPAVTTTTCFNQMILKTAYQSCRLVMVMQMNGQISNFEKDRGTSSFRPNNRQQHSFLPS
jgi:hypothetical protein